MTVILGAGGPSDRNSIALATRKGNPIENQRRLERAPSALKASRDLFASGHPDAKLRSLTATYNCVALPFASRRTWVDTNQLRLILEDDGFRKLPDPGLVCPGDIVIYKTGNEVSHVGIVLSKGANVTTATWNLEVLSKWGADGEYCHRHDDLPVLLGVPSEYWTERRTEP